MFETSRADARRFLFDVFDKYHRQQPLEGIEPVALEIILAHPEYHAVLADRERYLDRDYTPEAGETNPFLHLSLHLAVAEQISIDQPPGIRAHYTRLREKFADDHTARHALIDCLAEMIWQAQRAGTGYDAGVYFECLERQ